MKNNYEFNKYNKVFNYISILISVISIVFLLFKGLNFGVDFKGGTLIEIRIDNINVNKQLLSLSSNNIDEFERKFQGLGINFELFVNEIKIVVGDEWSAGNLSYHLSSRPVWINNLDKEKATSITDEQGIIYTGNPKILKKICPGVFGSIRPVGYCMIGKR